MSATPFGPTEIGDFHCGRCGTLLDGGTDEPVEAREAIAENARLTREVERLAEKAAGAEMWHDQARSLAAEVERLIAGRDYEYRVVGEWPDFKGTYAHVDTLSEAERWLPRICAEFKDGDVFIERRRAAGPWEALREANSEAKGGPGS